MVSDTTSECLWCDRPYQPRRHGSPQRFCGAGCRTAFWSALRRWGERAIEAGILTVADVRDGDPEACTLVSRATLPTPMDDVPRVQRRYTGQHELEQLMAMAIAARRR